MDSDAESEFFRLGKEYDLEETRISAWVLDHQESVVRGDLEKEQESEGDRRLVAEGIRSYCVVPLVAMGKSIGTFTVERGKEPVFRGGCRVAAGSSESGRLSDRQHEIL